MEYAYSIGREKSWHSWNTSFDFQTLKSPELLRPEKVVKLSNVVTTRQAIDDVIICDVICVKLRN